MNNKFYHVYNAGAHLKVVDAEKGIQVGVISPRGEVQSPFQISGNAVSFVVKTTDGSLLGTVHKLPSGQLINTFRA